MPQITNGALFAETYNKPLSSTGQFQAGCYRKFYFTQTTSLAPVYTDAGLTVPYSQTPTPITADAAGRFNPIYLDPSIAYRVQLWSAGNIMLEDQDPYGPSVPFSKAVSKSASTLRTNTVILADDPDLILAIPAAGIYRYTLDLYLIATVLGATPGIAFGMFYTGVVSAPTPLPWNAVGFLGAAAFGNGGPPINSSLPSNVDSASADSLSISGVLMASTAGNLSLRWAQRNTSANATTVLAGSAFTVTKVG